MEKQIVCNKIPVNIVVEKMSLINFCHVNLFVYMTYNFELTLNVINIY